MPSFIDFSHFTAAKNSFEGNPGLCNLFKFLSIETWKRLEFTYIKPKIKVFETTLTQNIAFTISAYANEYPGLLIDIWEADDESANGNDLEVVIVFSKYGFNFYAPVQAKKIYRNGHYYAMEHGDQIEKLIDYAEDEGGYPLYLLYNYVDPIPSNLNPENELYGCSIIDAYYLHSHHYNARIKKKRDGTRVPAWQIPHFDDLHPRHAFPWHELVCDVSPSRLYERLLRISDMAQKIPPIDKDALSTESKKESWKKYPGLIEKDALSYRGWFKSEDKEILSNKKDKYFRQMESQENYFKKDYVFNPQTRIVITV